MPRNGSGTYTLAQPAFVPSTVISSTAMNSDLSDIATALTGSIAADGQTTITAQLKGASGSVGVPSYSFSADLDTGMYRIGANNIGLSVNATKIVDIATTGVSIVGTLAVSGAYSPAGQILGADGSVSLPEFSYTADPDTGTYRIGANNIGIAVNATKILDISTTGLNVIGTVSANGAVLSPQPQAAGMINGTIVESHSGNAVTFALKTLAGADPSATDPVFFAFRNATAATGNYVVLTATAAMSLVVSSGSTLGTTSATAFKLWLVMFNDASTLRMGVINCVSGTTIYPLGQFPIATSTAEGGAGAADSAQVFYTGTAVTSKAYIPIAYAAFETGQSTAGSWAASPTRMQLVAPGTPMPGTEIQVQENYTGAVATGTTAVPADDTIPQITEGTQFLTQAITPTSAAHILRIMHKGMYGNSGTAISMGVALFQDATANALTAGAQSYAGASDIYEFSIRWSMLAATTSATTFRIRAGDAAGNTTSFNGSGGTRRYGGVANSFLSVLEICT